MLIAGISGSLRRDSHNTRLLRAAATKLPPGARLAIWDELAAVPPFDEDAEHVVPPAVRTLKQLVTAADGLLIATPEYNASVPGQLKNALDWASRPLDRTPLRGRPAAVMGASTGLFGAVWAQADLRRVLDRIGAQVVDVELPIGQADRAFTLRGDLHDPAADTALGELVDELVGAARRFHERDSAAA